MGKKCEKILASSKTLQKCSGVSYFFEPNNLDYKSER